MHRRQIKGARHHHAEGRAEVVVHPPARIDLPAHGRAVRKHLSEGIHRERLSEEQHAAEEEHPGKIGLGRPRDIAEEREEKINKGERQDLERAEGERATVVVLIADAAQKIGSPEQHEPHGERGEAHLHVSLPHVGDDARKKEHQKGHDENDDVDKPVFGIEHRVGVAPRVVRERGRIIEHGDDAEERIEIVRKEQQPHGEQPADGIAQELQPEHRGDEEQKAEKGQTPYAAEFTVDGRDKIALFPLCEHAHASTSALQPEKLFSSAGTPLRSTRERRGASAKA